MFRFTCSLSRNQLSRAPLLLLTVFALLSPPRASARSGELGSSPGHAIALQQESNTAQNKEEDTPSEEKSEKKDNDRPLAAADLHEPVLWRQPENIGSLDLLQGQGGESHQPAAPFTFEKEAKGGSNPKFDVRDSKGRRWRVKLGEEARPEVVASRLLWAVGYFANDDYLLPDAEIQGIKLKRGKNLVHDGHITDARFARKPGGQHKIGVWQWKGNSFMGTREFNGLRTLMAVINNWDLKDENNAVFHDEKTGKDLLLVSDVGATFATTHITNSRSKDKGNVETFADSKFILRQTDSEVDFATPAPPTGLLIGSLGFTAGEYFKRRGLDWIGKNIPRADARWMGSLLTQLTHQQLVDAFHAGHFPEAEVDQYVGVVEERIQQLKAL